MCQNSISPLKSRLSFFISYLFVFFLRFLYSFFFVPSHNCFLLLLLLFIAYSIYFVVCLCYIFIIIVLGDIILLLFIIFVFWFCFFSLFFFFGYVGKIRKEIVVVFIIIFFRLPVVRCLKEQIVCVSLRLLFIIYGWRVFFHVVVDKDLFRSQNVVINRLWNIPWTFSDIGISHFFFRQKQQKPHKKTRDTNQLF